MTGRIFTSADYAALKNAVRRACQQAGGGLRGIAELTRSPFRSFPAPIT